MKSIRYSYHSLLTMFLEVTTDNALSALVLVGYTDNWLTALNSLP